MEEKNMVNDVQESCISFLKEYQNYILECNNMELRQLLQNLRNTYESFQYEILKLAESIGYSIPEEKATLEEVIKVRNEFAQ